MDTDARTSAAAIRQHLIEKAARLPERPALAVALAIRVVKRPFAPPLPASLLSLPALSPRTSPSALVTIPVSLILIVVLDPRGDLVIRAKHLFVAPMDFRRRRLAGWVAYGAVKNAPRPPAGPTLTRVRGPCGSFAGRLAQQSFGPTPFRVVRTDVLRLNWDGRAARGAD